MFSLYLFGGGGVFLVSYCLPVQITITGSCTNTWCGEMKMVGRCRVYSPTAAREAC